MAIPNAEELLKEALAEVFPEMQNSMPGSKDILGHALMLAMGHICIETAEEGGDKTVIFDGEEIYEIRQDDKCTHKENGKCQEAENRNGFCRHRLARTMWNRAKSLALRRLNEMDKKTTSEQPAINFSQNEPLTEDGKTQFAKEYEEAGGIDFDDLPENPQTAQGAEEVAKMFKSAEIIRKVEQKNLEPHSITLKGITEDGFEFLFCLRGHNVNDLVAQARTAKREMVAMKIRGTYSAQKTGTGQNGSSQPAQNTAGPKCTFHHVPMEERQSKQGGTFIAHKVGEKNCYGNWCEEHDTSFFLNDRDGRKWWSHKTADGSYCNSGKK